MLAGAKQKGLENETESESSGTGRDKVYVRTYQPRDIPRMIDLIDNAVRQLPNYSMITPSRERIKYVLVHNIDNATAFCGWVLCDSHDEPQGGAAGWCVQSIFSEDLVADDVIMWIEPKYRSYFAASILVNTYLDWARARGAKLIRASHTGGSWPRGSREFRLFDMLLKRLKFREVGNVYHYSEDGEE